MDFRNWWLWVNSQPWSKRWFILLVLIRPVIDNFYYLKEISPFYSPLYWVGILTPLFCLPTFFQNSKINNTKENQIFNLWSLIVFVNAFLLFFQPFGFLNNLQFFLRLTVPVFLFIFLRSFIISKNDLIGLLTTFLISVAISAFFMIDDAIINPKFRTVSTGRLRIETSYADIFNYSVYITFGFLIATYFFLQKKNGLRITSWKLAVIFLFFSLVLFRIGHFASYAVFSGIIVLFLLQLLKKTTFESIVIGIFILSAVLLKGKDLYNEKVNPMVEREVEVVQGKRQTTQLFHGRMLRWNDAWNSIKNANSIFAWLFGYALSLNDPRFNVTIGIHNDYLRIFYLSGILGLILYFSFLFLLWRKRKYASSSDKYLLTGSFLIVLLYSVSSTPTLYPNILYMALSIFAFFSHPGTIIYAESKA